METGEHQIVVGSPWRQYVASIIANILFISVGCALAWTSPVFLKLDQSLTKDEESWIGSLSMLGAALGPVLTGVSIDRIGRKGTIYVIAFCFLLSWTILSLSINAHVLYVGRIIGGLGIGGAFTSVPVFVAEISDNERRGSLGSFNQFFIAIGFLIEYTIGTCTSYLGLTVISGSMVLLFLVLFFFIPESPYFLLAKGRRLEAIDSLSWFRGKALPHQIQHELTAIEDSIMLVPKKRSNINSFSTLFLKKGTQKALMICFYLLIIQHGSAFNAMIAYTHPIFEKTKIQVSASLCAIIVGLTNLVSSGLAPILVKRFGLKPVILASSFGTGICEGILGLYFHVQELEYDVSSLSFIPIMALIFINLFFCCGLGPLPWAVVAEMFPLEVKSIATASCGVFAFLVGFAVVKGFAIFINFLGPGIVFVSLCLFMVLGSIGEIFIIPNTTGMSLKEIQEYLDSGEKKEKKEKRKGSTIKTKIIKV